jgi:azurin
MKLTRNLFVFATASALLLAGCGDAPKEPAANGPAQSSAEPQPADGRPIEITGNDQMKYNVTQIRAKAGERLSVTLVNVGTMPKVSMGHNWILLKPGTDATAYVNAGATAATNDYKSKELADQVIASTKLLGPNERDTVTFNAPTKPGEYAYVCSFPGHFQVGMKGVLIVE